MLGSIDLDRLRPVLALRAASPIRLQYSFQFKSPTKKSVAASIAPEKSSEVSK